MTGIQEMILYREMPDGGILEEMTALKMRMNESDRMQEESRRMVYKAAGELTKLAADYGFEGNLWHCYLSLLLVNSENPYSISCEIRGDQNGSLSDLAMHDFNLFYSYFTIDLKEIDRKYHTTCMAILEDFHYSTAGTGKGRVFNRRICERICSLGKRLGRMESAQEFMIAVSDFYKEFGVGKLGLHKAFRVEKAAKGAEIVPIRNIAHVDLDDLVGYETAKKKLVDNTEAFVMGKQANNCLLFGDAGTGKSSSIKGILNRYYDKGLRMIEIYKHQFQYIHDVIAQVKNRNYRFIIYMDDLSFEDFEVEYKYLKAVIEGGLEKKPENVLIYATSNRRHLIQERFSDKEGRRDQLHPSDTTQEKLSLAARFGISIFFSSPDRKEFQEIVRSLAARNGLEMEEQELLEEANKWELNHGGLSGRTAQQFIDYLCGRG